MSDLIEGRMMTDDIHDSHALEHLRDRIKALHGPDRARFAEMVEASKLAGRSFAASETPSHRRFEIARGLLLLLEDEQFDRDLITDLCRFVTGKQYKKAGAALADLNSGQAAQFSDLCRLLCEDRLALSYNPQTNQFQVEENSHE